MSQKLFFATNRVLNKIDAGIPDFTDVPIASGAPIVWAAATIDKIDTTDQDSGKIMAITPLNAGGLSDGDLNDIVSSPNDIVVFIHGADNDFNDSLTRAAYNQAWLGEQKIPGGNKTYDMIAFSWPGRSYDLSSLVSILHVGDDYCHDQDSANASGPHLCQFFKTLYALREKIGTRRMSLLAHSMGCLALGGGVEQWFSAADRPGHPLFDEVILAAGDENCTSLHASDGGRLTNLYRLGREISVYFNRNDTLMHLSSVANEAYHLGFNGPPNKASLDVFPAKIYEFIDCDGLRAENYLSHAGDHRHQYYREAPIVRLDIATALAGLVPKRPIHNPKLNYYAFFDFDTSGQI